MTLKLWQFASIILSALVAGAFWGPWLALSRSLATFEPDTYLAIVHRLGRNLGPTMTFLMPISLLSMLPVLLLSYGHQPLAFFLTLAGLASFLIALLVTMLVEVPLVQQMHTWTVDMLPHNWQSLRDRWGVFHVVRVVSGLLGLCFLVAGAIFV